MLKVFVEHDEYWDENKNEFIPAFGPVELTLEHSLVSLSKWESKWHMPYLSTNLSYSQTVDYIRCMTITQNVKLETYEHITSDVINQVADYIANPMTATWFSEDKTNVAHKAGRMNGEVITAEIIYYWMIANNIPSEYQKWHLNRLLTLIRVISEKNKPPKKKSRNELINQYASLNAQRRAKLGTRG